MTPSARRVCHHSKPPTHIIRVIVAMVGQYQSEEFSEADVLVNIVHHTLVPTHEVLTTEKKRLFMEE